MMRLVLAAFACSLTPRGITDAPYSFTTFDVPGAGMSYISVSSTRAWNVTGL